MTVIRGLTISMCFFLALPSIIQNIKGLHFRIGSTVVIKCETEGKPKPDVFWINEDGYSPVSPPKITQISSNSLKIINLSERDSRTLICIAQNKHGRARAKFSMSSIKGALAR